MDYLRPVIVLLRRVVGDAGKGLLQSHMGDEGQGGRGGRSSLVIYIFYRTHPLTPQDNKAEGSGVTLGKPHRTRGPEPLAVPSLRIPAQSFSKDTLEDTIKQTTTIFKQIDKTIFPPEACQVSPLGSKFQSLQYVSAY